MRTRRVPRRQMKAEGLSDAAIAAFKYNFAKLTSGESLFLPDAVASSASHARMCESTIRLER